ncbi:cation-transporting P-type ATPase [Nocardioides sp. zg-DK7169]|uniref:P-type ATPase n=1 Tax=Nocardioides sp. zg-DK7169 TaxID=2736600 RepID=UPI001C12FF22|nr:cation-transporting P-type ATPase [Nocardioides sp. zg-DK7169]
MTDHVDEAGLTGAEAAQLLSQHGPNQLPPAPREPAWRKLAAQLTHLLALLLWIAAGLAVLAGMPEIAVAVVAIIVLNAAFAFWQEHRADRSAEQLQALVPSRTRVVRDGRVTDVEVADLVPGDLVLLAAGDRVGADAEVVEGRSLALDESVLTGESTAVPHASGEQVMCGTYVVQVEGSARVTATGADTTLAGISRLAGGATRPPSPMTTQLN